ncbi:MAG: hypothetical protein KAR56_01580 [Thermoplasmata archaeon]|nr:hypothetical protein [Thermoplasmata archaeon]
MYDKNEVAISNRYLKEVITTINEPIVIIGGWAVYFLVNDRYRETTGRDYIGSRDIDLGFSMAAADLENSAFVLALKKLEDDLGFELQAFKLFKEIHAETGEVLAPELAKKMPLHQIFPMYVDLIVDKIPEGFREQFGFTPIDEPLLEPVFADPGNRTEIGEYGKQLWLPSTNMMLAMKMKSHPNRDKEHKRIKDMADISALLLFGSIKKEEGWLASLLSAADITRFKNALTPEDIGRAAQVIGIEQSLIENAISLILK